MTTPQFHHSYFFPVLYSEHKIFLFSSFDTFSPAIIFFLLYLIHLTLLSLLIFISLFLHFYALRQFPHYIFFSSSPETNLCPHFFFVFVPLYLHPLYSTDVTTSHLVFHPLSSIAVLLRGIPHALLYSYAFFYGEPAGFSFYYISCGVVIHATTFSCFLLSTSMLEHFHL